MRKPTKNHPWRFPITKKRMISVEQKALEDREQQEIDMENRYDKELEKIAAESGGVQW